MKKFLFPIFLLLFLILNMNMILAQIQISQRTVSFHSKNYHSGNKDLISGQGMFIPDGPTCPPGYFIDTIDVRGFPAGFIIDSANDLKAVIISIEHSFAGDLGFELICPNGQSVVLDGNDHSGNSYLGIPLDGSPYDNGCLPADNPPGTPWVYGWSQTYPQQGSLNVIDAIYPSPPGIPPINTINNSGYFTSDQPFSNLIGCPLNGPWMIKVTDNWGSDNGYIFGWEVIYDGHTNITGKVFYDGNANGIQDTLEPGMAGQLIKIEPGPYYKTVNNDGSYEFCRDTGTYTISSFAPVYWEFSTDSSFTFTTNDPNIVASGIDFGMIPTDSISDVAINYIGASSALINNNIEYWLDYKNLGTLVQQGTVHLVYDTLLTLISSSITPNIHTANLMEWNYSSLLPLQDRQIIFQFQTPDVSFLGDTLINYCWIDPLIGDTNIVNNSDTLFQLLTGPYDPNKKEVLPIGVDTQGFVLQGQKLTYTIYFQNTGNDTARTVVIKDKLDEDMNIETLFLIASSYPLTYEINDTGLITFLLQDIMLPDSLSDEAGSKGFIKFSLMPLSGLADSTEVTNTGYIFFDYNPSIVTNQVLNTYVKGLPENVGSVSTKNDFILFPNPFSSFATLKLSTSVENADLRLYDILGKIVKYMEGLNGKEIIIQRENLKGGIYFFLLMDRSGIVGNGKIIVE
jgi:uncharacterized repeat protein (TIGR01451 family)